MPGISVLILFSQCRQAPTFLLVSWSDHTRGAPSPPHLPAQASSLSLHPHMNYCQSTPNALSTADLNHVEELLVPIELRMCLYNSKNWAIPVMLWLCMFKTVAQIKAWNNRSVTFTSWTINRSHDDICLIHRILFCGQTCDHWNSPNVMRQCAAGDAGSRSNGRASGSGRVCNDKRR